MNINFFEKNLSALKRLEPDHLSNDRTSLFYRLCNAKKNAGKYKILTSSSGDSVPAFMDSGRALHSLIDPRREAERLAGTLKDEGFIVVLGLGGGYLVEAALERENTSLVLAMDFDIDSIAELLCLKDYTKIFDDPRFYLLIDPDETRIEQFILNNYKPALSGGIGTIPLRARTLVCAKSFNNAGLAMEQAIKKVSVDYSVQAYFGTLWFSNIVRNIKKAEAEYEPLPVIRRAAVTAAGPSLDFQINEIRERRDEFFLMATDTSLPCLLFENIFPDAVVSIDCQHIGFCHFMAGLPEDTYLFLDLASPAAITSQSAMPFFFSGGHPLTGYVSRAWRVLPEVDTSGGNITHACVSLAEKLGAESVELFGADFSYPMGLTYARGAYIHPFFEQRQKRLAPLESQNSAFLYRGGLEKKIKNAHWYYESPSLNFYREQLELKTKTAGIELIHREGLGAPVKVFVKAAGTKPRDSSFYYGKCQKKAEDFLAEYSKDIRALPVCGTYNEKEKIIFTTLLPAVAALRRRNPELKTKDLLEKTISHCVSEIEKVIATRA